MVHFSARLGDNLYADWRDDALGYGGLKASIKTSEAKDHVHARGSHTNTSQRLASVGSLESQPLLLMATLHKGPGCYDGSGDVVLSFDELLAEQLAKVEAAYVKHLAQLRDEFALVKDQFRPDASSAARDSVANTIMELHRQLNHLLNFALLNYTGFVRILKKHDNKFRRRQRQHAPSLSSPHHRQLRALSFSHATQCHALATHVERAFADWFCDGNKAVAVASLLTRKEDALDWTPVSIGIKMGACLVLLAWVLWDTVVAPTLLLDHARPGVVGLAVTRAYPVYRGLGCCLLLHWLLGVSMYVWHAARINYRYMLELDPHTTPHYTDLLSGATNLSIVYLVNVLLYYKVVNGDLSERLLPRGYYPIVMFVYAAFVYVVRPWRQQRGLLRTLGEIVVAPLGPVTFFHVLVANYLTSLAKVNQDLAWSLCFVASGEFLHTDVLDAVGGEDASCQNSTVYVTLVVPLICVLPLWWCFLQNLRRIYDTGAWWRSLPNAAKYALAQVVTLFGLFHPFYQTDASGGGSATGTGFDAFHLVWLVLFTLSSISTWAWDVWMDWGLGRPRHGFLGDKQMFSRLWLYYAALVADLFLRFAWTLTLIPPHSSHLLPASPAMMVLELFRRSFWGILRLENEHLRNTQGFRHVDFIPLQYDTGVGDRTNDAANKPTLVHGNAFLAEIACVFVLAIAMSVLAVKK